MKDRIPHYSAHTHVSGESIYTDDIIVDQNLLIGHIVYSSKAHAKIRRVELSAARKVPGVHAVLSYRDIPGENQMGPVIKDELCLAEEKVTFIGQAGGSSFTVEFVMPWVSVAQTTIVAVIVAIVGAIFPAWQAGRIAPAESLRYTG